MKRHNGNKAIHVNKKKRGYIYIYWKKRKNLPARLGKMPSVLGIVPRIVFLRE